MKPRRLWIAPLALLLALSAPAHAQFLGYTSPQTVQQTLATNLPCTGAQQLFTVQNLGQNQHFATITPNGASVVKAVIEGIDASGFPTLLSDTLVTSAANSETVYGTGYFPIVKISVTCSDTSGFFTLSYSGTSSNAPVISGNYQQSQQVKIAFTSPASQTRLVFFQTPFGSSDALIQFTYQGGTLSGSTLTITCEGSVAGTYGVASFSVANIAGVQIFKIPPNKCPIMDALYTTGGASGATILGEIIFDQPGTANVEVANYSHITGTTATAVKSSQGVVTSVLVGTPAAGTISLFDLPAASCVMTPSTNVVAVLTELAATAAQPNPGLNLFFAQGICVKASAGMDFTVGFQ